MVLLSLVFLLPNDLAANSLHLGRGEGGRLFSRYQFMFEINFVKGNQRSVQRGKWVRFISALTAQICLARIHTNVNLGCHHELKKFHISMLTINNSGN